MPGWVKRGAVGPTFSTDTCNVCDPCVWHQSKAFLGAVLRGFSLQTPKMSCDRVRLALVLVSSHFAQDPVPGVQAWDASSKAHGFLEMSWLPQQSSGNFQLFLGLPFHQDPLQGSPQLETSLDHTHVTSKTLVTPVNWHRDPTSSGLQNLWGRAEDHGFLCDPVTHQLILGFPPVVDALAVLMNTPCHPLSCVQHEGMASACGESFVEQSRGFSERTSPDLHLCLFLLSIFFLFLSPTSPPCFPFPFFLYPFPFPVHLSPPICLLPLPLPTFPFPLLFHFPFPLPLPLPLSFSHFPLLFPPSPLFSPFPLFPTAVRAGTPAC